MVQEHPKKRLRVLFINRSYWPDSEATGQLLTELCEDLSTVFDVEVIAGQPNHPEAQSDTKFLGPIVHNRVQISYVWHTRFAKGSSVGRILNYVSFVIAVFVETLFRKRPDIVITETDPFIAPLLGLWLKWRYRCRFIAYLQDIYPDIAIGLGVLKESWWTGLIRRALATAYRAADRVVVLSPGMRQRCASLGVEQKNLVLIPNWSDCSQVTPVSEENRFRSEQSLQDKFVVMYSGNHGRAHTLLPILDAADQLREYRDIQFVFVGEGVQKPQLRDRAIDLDLRNVRFLGYYPKQWLGHSLSAADIHVVSLQVGAEGCVAPSKLYGVLAAGRAVVGLCPPDGDVGTLVNEERLGVTVDPAGEQVAQRLADAILCLRNDPAFREGCGQRGRKLCEREFDRPVATRRFAELLREIGLGERTTPPSPRSTERQLAST